MNRVSNSARRHRSARSLFPLAAALALVAGIGCSDDPIRYEPLDQGRGGSQAIVAGAVRDVSRAPVGGAVVTMEALLEGMPATARLLNEQLALAGKIDTSPNATSDELVGRRVTLTDSRGRFVFDEVPAGEYVLQVRADDHLGASRSLVVPPVTALLDTIIVDVNLTPTGTCSGVATLENATVHSNIVVYAEGTSYVAVTAADGSYAITDVPVGSYTVHAMHAHYLDDTAAGTITYAGENVLLSAMLLKFDNNIPPVATITIPAQSIETGTPVQFQGSGTDADGTVVLYEWDFENDGVIDSSSAVTGDASHVYTSFGTYTVKLRVTDNLGAIGLDAQSIFVGAPASPYVFLSINGNDVNAGTQNNPVLTLTRAYQVAQNDGKTLIKATAGTFNEVPAFLVSIDIEGGHDPSTWAPASGYTTFTVGTTSATANGISTATTISRVEIIASNQVTPANSIALYSTNSTSALHFDDCIFRAAAAGAGTSAGTGTPGPNGSLGAAGGNGSCDGTAAGSGGNGGASPVGCPGGKGGSGGVYDSAGANGMVGACGGGAAGLGGSAGDPGGDGGNGSPGTTGVAGSSGAASSPNGAIVGAQWVPAVGGTGSGGGNGTGGGGGGGGGGQHCFFCNDGSGNGGGGGGGTGGGGSGGPGGPGGYGSIAVLLGASSPVFDTCLFETYTGGAGGTGGNGGTGGIGGTGGLGSVYCQLEIGTGGNGGNGGSGGGGGGGAGGAGGPSVGIVFSMANPPTVTGATYTLGTPGPGGAGGQAGGGGPFAPAGSTGVAASTLGL